jgi:hypothetical protein
MPTILRVGSTRFFFFSNEAGEAPHIHVRRGDAVAKFWLTPVSLASSRGLRAHEIRWFDRIVRMHQQRFPPSLACLLLPLTLLPAPLRSRSTNANSW